ncbi:hypothetical protein DY000_02015746 [Brassica cretica]|uniref:Uncharacterized protein n=1 Tax=Brassica cretica TaxID=69181 RepID=A0ABQ7CT49_BRACR|nr:hypothetical protein DY000_02015746 [Brassica cretica]
MVESEWQWYKTAAGDKRGWNKVADEKLDLGRESAIFDRWISKTGAGRCRHDGQILTMNIGLTQDCWVDLLWFSSARPADLQRRTGVCLVAGASVRCAESILKELQVRGLFSTSAFVDLGQICRIRQGSGPVKLIDLPPLPVSWYGVPDVLSLEVCLIYSSLYCLAWAASPISNLFSGARCRTKPVLMWVFTSSIESGEAFLRRVSGGSSYSTSSISFVCLCRRVFKLWLVLLKIEECESDLFDLLELVGLEALLVCGRLFSTGWVVPLCVKLQDVKLCYSLVCNRGFPEFLVRNCGAVAQSR